MNHVIYPIALIVGVLAGAVGASGGAVWGWVIGTACVGGVVWYGRAHTFSARTVLIIGVLLAAGLVRGAFAAPPVSAAPPARFAGQARVERVTRTDARGQTAVVRPEGGKQTIILVTRGTTRLTAGDRIRASCPAVENGLCFATAVHRTQPVTGMHAALARLRSTASERMAALLPYTQARVAQAMIIGDRSGLPDALTEQFAATGTMHLLAISGAHIAGITILLFYALQYTPLPRPWRYGVSAVIVVLFVLFVGAPASAVRGAGFAVVAALALAQGRPRNSLLLLAIVAAAMLFWNPALLFSVGFQLSVVATFGIIVGVPLLRCYCKKFIRTVIGRRQNAKQRNVRPSPFQGEERRGYRYTSEYIVMVSRYHLRRYGLFCLQLAYASLAATVATLPIVVLTFGRISFVTLPANLFAGSLFVVLIPSLFILLVIAFFAPVIAPFLAFAVSRMLDVLLDGLAWFASIPWSSVILEDPPVVPLAVIYAALLFIVWIFWARSNEPDRRLIHVSEYEEY